jgi:hypothetical protein
VSLNKDILPYLSTTNVARDMDGIHAAMGDKKLNYFGSRRDVPGRDVYEPLPEQLPLRGARACANVELNYGPRARHRKATWLRLLRVPHCGSSIPYALGALHQAPSV